MALTPTQHALINHLAPQRAKRVEELRHLVSIPTGHRNATGLDACRDWFRARFESLGATCRDVDGDPAPEWLREGVVATGSPPPMLVATRTHQRAAARVLLCGHIDTVHDPAGTFRQLVVSQDGKTATGPGCADMKGGLLVSLAALEAIEAFGVPISWTFAIISDEETGTFHADASLRALARTCANEHFDAGLVFEPAMPDGGLVIERPGSGQFMIECRGRAAHVGRDFTKGVSAVHALAEAITKAGAFADPAQGLILSIGPIEGGSATNIVPNLARAWGNVRCFRPAAEARAREQLASLNKHHNMLPSTQVDLIFNRPAKPSTDGVLRLAALARDCLSLLHESRATPHATMNFSSTGGVCDGNNIQAATENRLPVIDTLGVRGGGLHTTEEWIELDSLVERAQLTALLMERLASGAMCADGARSVP